MSVNLQSELLRAVQSRAWQRSRQLEEEHDVPLASSNTEQSPPSVQPESPNHRQFSSSSDKMASLGNEIKSPLTDDFKEELLRVAHQKTQERTQRMIHDHPGGHRGFSSELLEAFHQRENRRNLGALSLRPFKNSRYYKAQAISAKKILSRHGSDSGSINKLDSSDVLLKNISKVERMHHSPDRINAVAPDQSWTPSQDLPDEDLDDDISDSPTQRARNSYEVNWAQIQTQTLFKKNTPKSPNKSKASRMKKIQRSMRHAFGSIRGKLGSDQSMRSLSNDGWVIMPTESFDTPPKKPVQISHVESGSAYAFHSERGEMYLIPNFDKILVTDEGLRIPERQLSTYGSPRKTPRKSSLSNSPILLGHVVESHNLSRSSQDLRIEEERKKLQEVEAPFRVIQQMNANYRAEEDGRLAEVPTNPVWKLMTSCLDPSNPYATVRSTHSGWSETHSPQKMPRRTRTTSVVMSSDDELDDNDHAKSTFQIMWRNDSCSEDPLEAHSPRVVEGSEDAPVIRSPTSYHGSNDRDRKKWTPCSSDDITNDLNDEFNERCVEKNPI
jgi:hypothetical protein